MTRADIVAELRRSACEDVGPFHARAPACRLAAHHLLNIETFRFYFLCSTRRQWPMFYLIVAQALDQSKEG